MKALILEQYNQFALRDVPEPVVAEDEVLVQVRACGICGSDVHGMDGSSGRRIPPIIMGHEAAGVIAAVGPRVTDWKSGDRVTFDSTIFCATCEYCRRGEVNLCDRRRVLGVSCPDYRQPGAFAEYVAVPAHILYRLPDQVSFTQAAMIEPVSIAFHAASRAPLPINASVAVVGAGMIGLLVVQTLRLAGCGQIIAIDLDADRLELASEFGADETVNSTASDPAAEILRLTGGRGVDVAFEVAGIGATFHTAFHSVRKGGAVVLVGNISPQVSLPLQLAVTRQITLYGSCASSGEYPACLDMLARGHIRVEKLISACAPLSEGGDWFRRLYLREPGLMKVILQPTE